ncbi:MAG: D-alanyl-D-alanine carboxypeptidase family protein [Sneathiellaceae bacterium]
MTAPAQARKYASIIVDARTGDVLHERHAADLRYPASLTKIMTLMLAFDAIKSGKLDLEQRLKVSAHAAAQPPSKLGLRAGQTITVRELILALVTKSANDAAVVLAEGLGGTESGFARKMTSRARQLGMKDTTFRNASGLPDRRQQTTARDMAKLALGMLSEHPDRYRYFSIQTFNWRGRTYKNHNHLLGRYEGTDGIKTGYIRDSGYNLVASVQRDGQRLIGVVFGGRTGASRDTHMAKLLDRGFRHLKDDGDLIQEAFKSIELPSLISSAHAATPWAVPLPRPRPTSGAALLAQALSPRSDSVAGGTAFSSGLALGRDAAIGQVEQGDASDDAAPAGPTRLVAARPATPSDGSWAIQVGAFRGLDSARRRAADAASRAPGLLSTDQVRIMPLDTQQGRLYRARLIGLTQRSAVDACRRLVTRDFSCITLSPGTS